MFLKKVSQCESLFWPTTNTTIRAPNVDAESMLTSCLKKNPLNVRLRVAMSLALDLYLKEKQVIFPKFKNPLTNSPGEEQSHLKHFLEQSTLNYLFYKSLLLKIEPILKSITY